MSDVELFQLSAGDLSLLQFLSQSSAKERAAGEAGWLFPPDDMPPPIAASLKTLIERDLVEASSGWVKPTQAGENALAQVEAAHTGWQ